MQFKNLRRNILLLVAIFTGVVASAQTATVKIRKEMNGQVEEIEREIEIKDGEDIEQVLKELGILDELGQLEDGQAFEITVKKLERDGQDERYDLRFYPEAKVNTYAFLGVMVDATADGEGARVSEIITNSGAAESKLQEGDVITKIDRVEIKSYTDLSEAIKANEPGTKVKITFTRDGKEMTTRAVLGEKQEERRFEVRGREWPGTDELPWPENFEWNDDNAELELRPFLGVQPGMPAEQGVRIGEVIVPSSANDAGLQDGDIILSWNGQAVSSFDALAELIRSSEPGSAYSLQVIRDGKEMEIKGNLGSKEYRTYGGIEMAPFFRGMDENGNAHFDLNLQFDSLAQGLNQLGLGLNELGEGLNGMAEGFQGFDQLMRSLDSLSLHLESLRPEGFEVSSEMTVTLEIDNLTDEDLAAVNEFADPKLKAENNLEMDMISFFPNPTTGQFMLQFALPEEGTVRVLVYSPIGEVIIDERLVDFSGTYRNMIDLSDQADGAYYLQVIQEDKSFSKKIIKGS